MESQNITLRLTCPIDDKLCFDSSLFPFVFYLEKFKKEQEDILNGLNTNVSSNFRLLMYLLSRNHYLFETKLIAQELTNEEQPFEVENIIPSIFENTLEDVIQNLDVYLKELILEGYLDYIFVKE